MSCPWLRLVMAMLSDAPGQYPFLDMSCTYNQYLNCRGDASPHRQLASPHRDLASPHRDLGVPPSRFERWMIRQKRPNSSPNFCEKPLLFSAKTFFFGVHSISAAELRNLH